MCGLSHSRLLGDMVQEHVYTTKRGGSHPGDTARTSTYAVGRTMSCPHTHKHARPHTQACTRTHEHTRRHRTPTYTRQRGTKKVLAATSAPLWWAHNGTPLQIIPKSYGDIGTIHLDGKSSTKPLPRPSINSTTYFTDLCEHTVMTPPDRMWENGTLSGWPPSSEPTTALSTY